MHQHLHRVSLVIVISIICGVLRATNGDYLIGVGSFDMTGPAAGVKMMGYANMDQSTAGIHFRLRGRTFALWLLRVPRVQGSLLSILMLAWLHSLSL